MAVVIANCKQPPRIIATASPDISEMVIEGGFLSALFYKIKEFTIALPPLRDCQDDIMLLADFYLPHYNQEFHKQVKRFDASAQKEMRVHSWSGNIRELKHVVRVAVLKSRGEIITPKELDFDTPNTQYRRKYSVQTKNRRRKKQNHIRHSPCQRQSHPSSQSPRYITQNPSGEKEKVRTKIKQPDFLIVVFSETDNVVFR